MGDTRPRVGGDQGGHVNTKDLAVMMPPATMAQGYFSCVDEKPLHRLGVELCVRRHHAVLLFE